MTRGEGADDCPDAAGLAEQVHRLAGASVVSAEPLTRAPSETFIQVAIVRNFGGYRAEINAGGLHHGSRSLEDLGPSCSSLADAIAITIAIFLDPYAAAPTPRPAPAEMPIVPPPRALPRHETPRRERPSQPRLNLDLAGGASLGALAETAPIMTGRVGWRATERWSIALGGAFVFPDSVSPTSGGTVDLGLSYGYLMGCARAFGDLEGAHLDWCAGALLGSLYGKGHGYDQTSTEHAVWSAIAAGPEILLPFTPRLAWSLAGLAALPLARNGFDVEHAGQRTNAFRSSAIAGLVTIGVRGEL